MALEGVSDCTPHQQRCVVLRKKKEAGFTTTISVLPAVLNSAYTNTNAAAQGSEE